MIDATLKRRVAALVIGTLLAMSAAAGTSAMFANSAQADDSGEQVAQAAAAQD